MGGVSGDSVSSTESVYREAPASLKAAMLTLVVLPGYPSSMMMKGVLVDKTAELDSLERRRPRVSLTRTRYPRSGKSDAGASHTTYSEEMLDKPSAASCVHDPKRTSDGSSGTVSQESPGSVLNETGRL